MAVCEGEASALDVRAMSVENYGNRILVQFGVFEMLGVGDFEYHTFMVELQRMREYVNFIKVVAIKSMVLVFGFLWFRVAVQKSDDGGRFTRAFTTHK